ncbi:hypothetical protein CAEBREN_19514 [Caenorhabditis brenneri]|uniref:Uncharacterized protein n=1 Tax=Caenorhabditis brenneri TaxID=135651 RepID=G0PML9_CAEBE|nr:hypothetical protein CAEBREN_19514 [Caenorhabditis brenneri]
MRTGEHGLEKNE